MHTLPKYSEVRVFCDLDRVGRGYGWGASIGYGWISVYIYKMGGQGEGDRSFKLWIYYYYVYNFKDMCYYCDVGYNLGKWSPTVYSCNMRTIKFSVVVERTNSCVLLCKPNFIKAFSWLSLHISYTCIAIWDERSSRPTQLFKPKFQVHLFGFESLWRPWVHAALISTVLDLGDVKTPVHCINYAITLLAEKCGKSFLLLILNGIASQLNDSKSFFIRHLLKWG